MDPAYYTWIVLIAIGLIYGLLSRRKPQAPKKSSSYGHWIVLALVIPAFIFACASGNTALAFILGVMLMALIPVAIMLSIGSGIGAAVRKRITKDENAD